MSHEIVVIASALDPCSSYLNVVAEHLRIFRTGNNALVNLSAPTEGEECVYPFYFRHTPQQGDGVAWLIGGALSTWVAKYHYIVASSMLYPSVSFLNPPWQEVQKAAEELLTDLVLNKKLVQMSHEAIFASPILNLRYTRFPINSDLIFQKVSNHNFKI